MLKFLNVCPFEYTAVVVVGRLGSRNRSNPPVGYPSLLQLTVLNRPAIVV